MRKSDKKFYWQKRYIPVNYASAQKRSRSVVIKPESSKDTKESELVGQLIIDLLIDRVFLATKVKMTKKEKIKWLFTFEADPVHKLSASRRSTSVIIRGEISPSKKELEDEPGPGHYSNNNSIVNKQMMKYSDEEMKNYQIRLDRQKRMLKRLEL